MWVNDRHFWGVELLGALLAPRWPQMRSGPPVELHLEASWSLRWRQDGPSGAKMGQVGTKLAVKFGKLRTKRRILYIHKLPIHRKAATMLLCLHRLGFIFQNFQDCRAMEFSHCLSPC